VLSDNYELKLLGRAKPNIEREFFKAPINSTANYTSIITDVDVIIHMAAKVHVMNENSSDPLNDFRAVNSAATLNLARQAANNGVKKFIFVSTIKVNGESTSNAPPYKSSDIVKPEDPYGISKSEAEEQLFALAKETGLEIVIIRPPLVYGKGVKANFATLLKFVGKGFPLPLRAINNNKRSLVSVYNLVDLIKVCIEHPKATNQVFLVSDDNDISTSEMVALMAKVQGVNNYSIPFPVWCFNFLGRLLNKQDVVDRLVGSLQVDITHTKETLNWKPPYSVEEGFAKCVEKNKGKK
jgi:nucleoside-diphosphate-sugar epimerase